MRYDFDRLIERRNTSSEKWDKIGEYFGREDALPLWVADMDFPAPEPVVEALRKRAEHPFYGYTFPPDSLYEAIIDWLWRHHGWRVKKDWIVFTAGVVNGLFSAVEAFSRAGDEVIVQPPVYFPFFSAVKNTGRHLLHNQLVTDGRRYTMDFAGLEALFKGAAGGGAAPRASRSNLLILCSPHNPVGRVWTHDELSTLARICAENDLLILSDEIHCDLLIEGAKHTVTATLSEEVARNTVTFMSPAKTFNVPGLATSFAVIPDDDLRRRYGLTRAGNNNGNLFGYAAMEAAFRYGDEYLDQLRAYLTENVRYFADFVAARLPRLKAYMPEGTYLAWLDCRGLGLGPVELQRLVRDKARLALNDGYIFGPGGEGFQRVNLACPRSMLKEAMERLEAAVKTL
ncbi:MAG: MalY/PatB family protein [Bacillota bacterium]